MALRNHNRVFRPLRAGIEIRNAVLLQPGTIGLIATADGHDRWIISCHHVLCTASFPDQILQPAGDERVARSDAARARADLDCAAARLTAGIEAIPEVLGLGPPGEPLDPVAGMAVIKCGAATGLTEGVIRSVAGGRVEIRATGLPPDYQLSDAGDSGSVWLQKGTLRPVALHLGSTDQGFAIGRPIGEVLTALSLTIVSAG